jgi:hypothetical protein
VTGIHEGGILLPCPKCGSKHFMSGPVDGKVIFYCMADGCGHEWEINDKNSKKKMEVGWGVSVVTRNGVVNPSVKN